jgi:aminomethyltransferase
MEAQESLQLTALNAVHDALGAKMVPFAGYRMPVQYEGVSVEHHAVRV